MDKDYMRKALDLAEESVSKGQSPFGAVIVDKDGKVLAEEHNHVIESGNPTAHAEICAIETACEKTKSIDLSGCTIYCSCEPCPMCMAAIHWSNISRVVYGASIGEAKCAGFNEISFGCAQLAAHFEPKISISRELIFEATKILKKYRGKTY